MTSLTDRDFWMSVRRGLMPVLNAYRLKPNPTPLDRAWIGALTIWTEAIERRYTDGPHPLSAPLPKAVRDTSHPSR